MLELIDILVVLIVAGVIAFCIVCLIGIAIQLIFAGIVSMTMKLLALSPLTKADGKKRASMAGG
jgi:hypothetical protein